MSWDQAEKLISEYMHFIVVFNMKLTMEVKE